MSLKLTGGRARGRELEPVRSEGVRPTSSRVREAWFSMIGHDLSGIRFLDAYAGSGIMGLEAWSRGAQVVSIEQDRRTAAAIRHRCGLLGADVDVRVGDASQPGEAFDVVFADPPYAFDPAPIAVSLGACGGVVGLECRRGRVLPVVRGVVPVTRRFGDTELHVYRFPVEAL